jgi:hypothetical protein
LRLLIAECLENRRPTLWRDIETKRCIAAINSQARNGIMADRRSDSMLSGVAVCVRSTNARANWPIAVATDASLQVFKVMKRYSRCTGHRDVP